MAVGKVQLKTVNAADISDQQKSEMFKLFEEYYDHVTFGRFVDDLSEKTHVFFFREDKTNRLVGFSTILRKKIPEIAPGYFLFSGDTVVHRDYWGSKFLQKAFVLFILKSKLSRPTEPLYWMLMSKGVKTYLMMKKNFELSFPCRSKETPDHFKKVLDGFYRRKFEGAFSPETGLITFQEKLGSVKATLPAPDIKSITDPDALFFFKRNPDHEIGTELACVCEVKFTDFAKQIPKFFLGLRGKRR